MKILVICQYYYPEPFRITDICEELVNRGHEVTVVTGEPNYPEGIIYHGYEKHQHADEVINGVKVHRCSIIPRRTGNLYRFLNYFSFPYQAKKYVKFLMRSESKLFDVIFVNQLSPVMMAEPAIKYKKRFGTQIVLYCLDLWPESLVAGGVTRKSPVYKVFHIISKSIYQKMDRILTTSKMFKQYFEDEFGIDSENIEYLPQYAEVVFEPQPFKEPGKVLNLVFAGNIGRIQSVETIVRAAERMMDKPVHFHIVGSGSELDNLMQIAKGLDNITFYGRRPLEEMPQYYVNADAMLVTLKADSVLSLTLPGKVQSYLAAGKPIIGAINGEAASVINDAQCGFCGNAEDVDELIKNINLFLICDSEEKKRLGLNARIYYESNFSEDCFFSQLESFLCYSQHLHENKLINR